MSRYVLQLLWPMTYLEAVFESVCGWEFCNHIPIAEFLHYKEKCGKIGKDFKDLSILITGRNGVLLKLGNHIKKAENTSDFMWNICSP